MMQTLRSTVLVGASLAAGACTAGRTFPWPAAAGPPVVIEHAAVRTLNRGYDRHTSKALVRSVSTATRANLDFAAYHANVMILDPAPAHLPAPPGDSADLDLTKVFGGLVDSITSSIGNTPLTREERRCAMAFSPLVDQVAKWNHAFASGLEDVRSAVRTETWGGRGGPHIIRQRATEAFLHRGDRLELWITIELQPWVRAFRDVPDEDGDGFGEIYARVKPESVAEEALIYIRDDYATAVMSRDEIITWANELGSTWYPSYNTDLVEPGPAWPDATTEPAVTAQLAEQTFAAPTVVMLGKPQGEPIYFVLLVDGIGPAAASAASAPAASLGSTGVTPDPEPVAAATEEELAAHGGSWEAWNKEIAALHQGVRRALAMRDPSLGALEGRDGYLFFRRSLEQMVGGDLRAQKRKQNPFPVIVEYREILARHGVDFLFVPVPTKAAVYADKLASGGPALAGTIVTPYERKLLLELSRAGVEVIDLLPVFLQARQDGGDEIYMQQDTHWTDRGLQLAADAIAARVRRYPWFSPHDAGYSTRPASFTHRGDLPSRLPDHEAERYAPLQLGCTQVVLPDGTLYEDRIDSPITILGDSFTGVYQRTFCRHAGVSAHLARALDTPVDLVMSYGGGPNVRLKLARRGEDALANERLVIWIMAARDLYGYWEDWELLQPGKS